MTIIFLLRLIDEINFLLVHLPQFTIVYCNIFLRSINKIHSSFLRPFEKICTIFSWWFFEINDFLCCAIFWWNVQFLSELVTKLTILLSDRLKIITMSLRYLTKYPLFFHDCLKKSYIFSASNFQININKFIKKIHRLQRNI